MGESWWLGPSTAPQAALALVPHPSGGRTLPSGAATSGTAAATSSACWAATGDRWLRPARSRTRGRGTALPSPRTGAAGRSRWRATCPAADKDIFLGRLSSDGAPERLTTFAREVNTTSGPNGDRFVHAPVIAADSRGHPVAPAGTACPDTMDGMDAVAVAEAWAECVGRGERADHLWHPDVQIVNARGWVIETTYHGRDGLARWWDDLAEVFDDFGFVADSIEAVGEGRVLTTQRLVGTFRASGIPVELPWCSVLTVRDGLIVHAVGYLTVRAAREAL